MNRGEALLAAAKLVTEERNVEYGEPVLQLTHVQQIKNAVGHKDSSKLTLAEIECIDSICVKLSRLTSGGDPKEDTWLDIIGYASIGVEARGGALAKTRPGDVTYIPKGKSAQDMIKVT